MERTARHFTCAGLAGLMFMAAAPVGAQNLSGLWAGRIDANLAYPDSLAAIVAAQSGSASVAAAPPLAKPVPSPAAVSNAASVAPIEVAADTAAAPDRPDVFNSVAMPIVRTPLDDRWSRVEASDVGGDAARFAAALKGRDERAKLDAVNRYVNASIAFVDDSQQFGVADRWGAASDTLSSGRGDCEDYAIAKLAMLRRAGFADRNLYFVVLKDLVRRADHAVLVVRSEGRFLVLDNGTETLLDSASVRDYRPVLTFTAGQRFTHGYRRSAAPPLVFADRGVARTPGEPVIATAAGMPSSPFASR